MLISDVAGKVHVLNTNTFEVENVLCEAENKPIITSLVSYFGYCLITLDTEMNIRLSEISGFHSFTLKRSYKLTNLVKRIVDYSGRKVSQLNLESSPVLIRKVGLTHIAVSISQSLHIFKVNSNFQLKHIASFFSLSSTIIPYSTDPIKDESQEDVDLSCIFYVKGCFYEYDMNLGTLYEIC